jgi:hypothetical protein
MVIDLPWLIGDQWAISAQDLQEAATAAELVIVAPTGCDRSESIERTCRRRGTRSVALLFRDYLDDYSPLQRRQFAENGWDVVDVDNCESFQFVGLLRGLLAEIEASDSVLIDITGLPMPALAIFVRILLERNAQNVTWIYAEPHQYLGGAGTEFATGLQSVSPLRGFAAQSDDGDEGVFVVFAGYDSAALRAVADYRKGARPRYLVVPFPPLQAQMYQEGILRIQEVRDSLLVDAGDNARGVRVPAFDAWGTVEALGLLFEKSLGRVFTVAPLSTKPQTLGVFLWWSRLAVEQQGRVSIIAPRYARLRFRVSEGTGRIWMYRLYPGQTIPR